MTFIQQYLAETKQIIDQLSLDTIERMAFALAETREIERPGSLSWELAEVRPTPRTR